MKSDSIIDMSPFTGRKVVEVVLFMRYSYEYKRDCVDMYRKRIWPETPNGVAKEIFRRSVRKWVRIEDNC